MAFRSLVILAFSVAFFAHAHPIEVRGQLLRRGDDFRLVSSSQIVWPLNPASHALQQDLSELQSGDILEVSLERADDFSDYVLTEIHFVSVCRLVGLWVAADMTIVDIENFEDLFVYEKDARVLRHSGEQYAYVLAPEEGPGWTIFLAQSDRVLTGRLQLNGSVLKIRVWENSKLKFDYHLTPLYRATRHPQQCT